jgi:RNA polymerase-binding protein DksA
MEALTKEQITGLEQQLRRDRAAALGTVQDEIQRSGDPDDVSLEKYAHDAGDSSEADLETDTTISMAQRHAAELQEIDAALARIANGSYGECEECGGAIVWARLQAQPTARTCIACQERLEQRPGAPSRPTM